MPRSLRILCILWLPVLAQVSARAQTVEARLTSFTAPATLIRNTRVLPLRKGERLLPDDDLATGAGGRLVISLSDGSVVSLAANARVVLKDFRQTGNSRELLDVLVGRLRVKINKLSGRPNPYRINSPTASIAVRGTEFSVRVAASGETAVAVSEGLVEVVSLRDPAQRRLVEPGRNVIVRPNGDLSFRLPGPGGELEAQLRPLSEQASPYFRAAADAVALSLDDTRRAVTEKSSLNLPVRLAAFADGAFDSLLNPAYAAQFTRGAGRVYWLPTLSTPLVQLAPPTLNASAHPFDFAASAQASYFTPLGGRWVLGGGLAATHSRLETLTLQQTREERLGLTRTNSLAGALAADAGAVSLLAARTLGAGGRSSLGFKLEHTESRAALQTIEENREELADAAFLDRFFMAVDAHARRTTATLGLLHTFGRGDKLGLSFSYGVAGGDEQYQRDKVQASFGNPIRTRDVATRSAEIAVLLRGPITQRLFYGLEGGWLRERVNEAQAHRNSNISELRHIQRPRVGGGLGFALRPRTFLSADLSFVQRHVQAETREQEAFGLNREIQRQRVKFLNGHLALQSDVGRRLVASAAVLRAYEWRYFEPLELHERQRRTLAQFGLGWRLRPYWLAQYFLSTDFGQRGPSHTLVLRYAFGGERQ